MSKLFSADKKVLATEFDDDYAQPRAFDEIVDEYGRVLSRSTGTGSSNKAARLASASGPAGDEGDLEPEVKKEPQSALEHFEKAVEKEELGSLGDSLKYYRKAFRMDSAVDKKYKNKHFPAPAAPATEAAAPSSEAPEDSETQAVVPAKPIRQGPPPTLRELIMSFSGLKIETAPPPIEGMPEPPCPMGELPDELLVHIMRDVAADDVGDFVRLAQVCKKMAFLVATEDGIWGRVCAGDKFGFGNMHRSWQQSISWGKLTDEEIEGCTLQGVDEKPTEEERQKQAQKENFEMTVLLRKGHKAKAPGSSIPAFPPVFASWQRMFRLRPRIRFNGCYISTVNYIRAGTPSATLVTWNSPVHIVTYFRYLRFYRDGTLISLLTTAEPTDVIHFMTKHHLELHQGGAMPHLPSNVMQNALRGRWRMSGIPSLEEEEKKGDSEEVEDEDKKDEATSTDKSKGKEAAVDDKPVPPVHFSSPAAAIEAESDLVIETEGVGKYYYRMELGFRTAGKGTRNNKLNWRGFYSYDRMTDDWSEFGLKNYRPFYFSRVRSYGVGE